MILLQTALSADSPFLLNMTVNPQFLPMLNQQNTKGLLLRRSKTKLCLLFFVKTNSEEEHLVILAELVSTYHGVIHHHSFVSQDCSNKLLAKLCPHSAVASKLSCGRTKAASYVESILGPKAQEMCI